MNKSGAQMGEVIVWLLRLVMISILAIGIRTFMHTSAQYYESENSVFLNRILFATEGFMKYNPNFHQQYFFIIDYDDLLYDDSYLDKRLDNLFSSDSDIGIRVEVLCGDSNSLVGYYNRDYYKSRKWFTLNYFVDETSIPILCKSKYNNFKELEIGTLNIEMVSRFKMGQVVSSLLN